MGVLDDMTKGINERSITERKAKAAGPTLTPVGTESSPTKPSQVGIPDVPEVFLTNEAVKDIAKDLRAQAATLIAVADGLDNLTKADSVTHAPPDMHAAAKAAGKAADEKFAASFAAKQAEAQASVFPELDADIEEVLPEVHVNNVDGWHCPQHPNDEPIRLTSRKGRSYLACEQPGCERFEK